MSFFTVAALGAFGACFIVILGVLDGLRKGSALRRERVATPTLAQVWAKMPRDLTDEQADAALAATAAFLDIKGSALTVNREKMKARYRALVKFVEKQGKTND